jgi:hypothetical protein
LTDGAGTASGSFSGVYDVSQDGQKLLAFYPSDATGLTFAATTETTPAYTISYTVPAEYTYDSSNPASLQGFPMVGVFDDVQKAVSFKNAAAVLDVTIQNVPAGYSYAEVEAVDDNSATAPYLNGTGTISFVASGYEKVPVLAIKDDEGTTKSKKTKTSWNASTSGVLESVRVIIPLPAATYPKLVLTLGGENKTTLELKSWTDLGQVNRNERIASTITLDNIDASMKVVANADQATAALAAETPATKVYVHSLAETDGNTISLPANQVANSQSALTLQLSSVATGVTIDGTATATDKLVASELEIKAAAAATDGVIPSLNLNAPATTVTLSPIGENGKVSYGTVTVNTNLDSLIIGNGVTVQNLVITSGNVIVKDGGKISTSAKLSDGVTSGAIYYNAAKSPVTGAESGITVAPEDLLNILQGGTVKLSQDISVPKMITVTKALTLDLNGHNIKVTDTSDRNCLYFYGGSYGLKSSKPEFEIKNTGTTDETHGVISGSQNGIKVESAKLTIGSGITVTEVQTTNSSKAYNANAAILVDTEGELTVDGATVSDDVFIGISVYPDNGYYAALTVNANSTITGKTSAIMGNGTCVAANSTSIVINGGTLSNKETTEAEPMAPVIYHPQNGKLEIKGGELTGVSTGVEMRAGEVIISGGTITAQATTLTERSYGNGQTIGGAAVALSQHTTNLTTKATIKDNAVINGGAYAVYEKDEQDQKSHDLIGLDIQGGTINGKIYSENVTDFITGGTFSDLTTALTYATGKTASIKLSAAASVESLALTGKRDLTVDLDAKTLTVTGNTTDIINVDPISGDASTSTYGNVTFKNGTIKYSQTPAKDNTFAMRCSQGHLTLDGITLTSSLWGCALNAQGEKVKLDVQNKSSLSAMYYSISSNAAQTSGNFDYGKNTIINLTNSTFASTETGLMNNVPATFTIEDCTFKGNHQGALLRGGTYTFKGTNTIELDASQYSGEAGASISTDCHNTTTWKGGNCTAFAPLVIGNDATQTAYNYPTTVTFQSSATTVKTSGTYSGNYPGIFVTANTSTGNGVTISGLKSYVTIDNSITCMPQIQYGSSNITVDSQSATQTTITSPGATTTTDTSNNTNTDSSNS